MLTLKQITIVGCGLLGGSFALALRRAGFMGRITACGGARGPSLALERQLIDAIEMSFAQDSVCEADLIFLAAPIGGIWNFLNKHQAHIRPGIIVTDAGSTKAEICRTAHHVLSKEVFFIGGHPMAGSEQTGVEYARADLFEGATWALIQEAQSNPGALERLQQVIESCGAKILLTGPEAHDRAVALISHLPQLSASGLADLLGQAPHDLARQLAATGWRDMTRLAASSWQVWRDICLTNSENISAALDAYIQNLQFIKEALETRDFNQLRALFLSANESVEKQRSVHYRLFEKK